jgi:small-conductance mechanosensitive channel
MDSSVGLHEILRRGLSLGVIGAVGWCVVSLLQVSDDILADRFPTETDDNLEARAIHTRMRIFKGVAIVVIAVITASAMLMTFPSIRQLGVSLLASAGLVTLIVGMAARSALANIIAGLQIALTQPIRLDDVLVVDGEWGRVEEITTGFVVLRIWDSRTLVVPLTYFVEHPIENWTRTGAGVLASVYIYVDYTTSIESVRNELKTILEGSTAWDRKFWNLQVTDASERTVQLRALMSAPDSSTAWELRCDVRERLISALRSRYPQALPRSRATLSVTPDFSDSVERAFAQTREEPSLSA